MQATLCDRKDCKNIVENDESEYSIDTEDALLTITIKDQGKDTCAKCKKRIYYLAARAAFDNLKAKRKPKDAKTN